MHRLADNKQKEQSMTSSEHSCKTTVAWTEYRKTENDSIWSTELDSKKKTQKIIKKFRMKTLDDAWHS